MPHFANIPPVFLDTVIARLVPWFMLAASANLETARHAAVSMLASYNVETEEEIRLAAEIASFGFAALEALSQSMESDLSLNAILRLRGSANSSHRSANQCQRVLDRLRKERRMAAPTIPPAEIPAGETPAGETPAGETRAHPAASPKTPIPPTPSRQQRRANERAAVKAQRKQAELARRKPRPATPAIATHQQAHDQPPTLYRVAA